MMWGMSLFGLLAVVLLLFGIAALVKYLFFRRDGDPSVLVSLMGSARRNPSAPTPDQRFAVAVGDAMPPSDTHPAPAWPSRFT